MKSHRGSVSGILLVLTALWLFTLQSDAQVAPLAERNVNMVSGASDYKHGDPFLQRQKEVSVAVSSRNVQHLLGGWNDYRRVDVSVAISGADPDVKVKGDAWLGVFKSFDGGSSWKSELLPGYFEDTTPEGWASPIPVARRRTDTALSFPDGAERARSRRRASPAVCNSVCSAPPRGINHLRKGHH